MTGKRTFFNIPRMISQHMNESVVLLHGLWANRLVMSRLSHELRRHGYAVGNWGYWSAVGSIESHARQFRKRFLNYLEENASQRVHVVTHSMGGIIARRVFSETRPAALGKIVMLGPPNAGSHAARRLATPLGRLCPALQELSDSPDSYVNRLDEPRDIQIGIIAASTDFVVELDSTYLDCQTDHIVLPGFHGTLPWRRDTAEQVLRFLRSGSFQHGANARLTQSSQ